MKRTTVFLREGIEGDLRAIARRQRVAVAEIVREAIDEYVARSKERPRARPAFIAAGASGATDGAERHEELLWADPHDDAPSPAAKPPPSRRAVPPRRGRRR